MSGRPARPDRLVFTPEDVDLARSPLRRGRGLAADTYALGAFNPGLTRLANGNLLMMVRVAEALAEPTHGGAVRAVRWTQEGYRLDAYPLDAVDMTDPRQFALRRPGPRLLGLTSLSWLLPVELTADGLAVAAVHYDRAIAPAAPWQDLGVEDARISRVDGRWYMTACSVSAERHGTCLYTSDDAMDWRLQGLIFDHQNKDVLLFEGKVGGAFMALTRPLGEVYFAWPPGSPYAGGPSINLATSPDSLHWRPVAGGGVRARLGAASSAKVGGGTPPILTPEGWLTLYHGVEPGASVGIYRTYWALLDPGDPARVLRLADDAPLMEADAALTASIAHLHYLPTPVVFATGIVEHEGAYVVASGEGDLACRVTHLPKSTFA